MEQKEKLYLTLCDPLYTKFCRKKNQDKLLEAFYGLPAIPQNVVPYHTLQGILFQPDEGLQELLRSLKSTATDNSFIQARLPPPQALLMEAVMDAGVNLGMRRQF